MSDKPTPKPGPSPLRKVYDATERVVAARAEPLAKTEGFAAVLATYMSVNRRIGGLLGRATGGVLHLVNIPTVSDVKKLHKHLTSVDNHISDLIVELGGTSNDRPDTVGDRDTLPQEVLGDPSRDPGSGRGSSRKGP
jgi:hypothetical protein